MLYRDYRVYMYWGYILGYWKRKWKLLSGFRVILGIYWDNGKENGKLPKPNPKP